MSVVVSCGTLKVQKRRGKWGTTYVIWLGQVSGPQKIREALNKEELQNKTQGLVISLKPSHLTEAK